MPGPDLLRGAVGDQRDLVAVLEQARNDRRSDQTGRAGHKDVHPPSAADSASDRKVYTLFG